MGDLVDLRVETGLHVCTNISADLYRFCGDPSCHLCLQVSRFQVLPALNAQTQVAKNEKGTPNRYNMVQQDTEDILGIAFIALSWPSLYSL